jgi:hypothetical protein
MCALASPSHVPLLAETTHRHPVLFHRTSRERAAYQLVEPALKLSSPDHDPAGHFHADPDEKLLALELGSPNTAAIVASF